MVVEGLYRVVKGTREGLQNLGVITPRQVGEPLTLSHSDRLYALEQILKKTFNLKQVMYLVKAFSIIY